MELMNHTSICNTFSHSMFSLGGTPSTHRLLEESALGSAYDCLWRRNNNFGTVSPCVLSLLAFLKSHFMSHRKQWTSWFPLNSPSLIPWQTAPPPPSNSVCVGGRSMMMSLLAALEQASCVELACYQTVQYIFGTARWRTSWSTIDLFHYSVLTTLPGARGVFSPL